MHVFNVIAIATALLAAPPQPGAKGSHTEDKGRSGEMKQIWPLPPRDPSESADTTPQPKACPQVEKPLAEFDGAALRWLLLAAPEMKHAKVDPARYTIQVEDTDTLIRIYFLAPTPGMDCRARHMIRGSTGLYLDFIMEIDKSTAKVVSAAWRRPAAHGP
jgi:hypothetical protein